LTIPTSFYSWHATHILDIDSFKMTEHEYRQVLNGMPVHDK